MVANEGPTEWAQTIDERELDTRLGLESRSEEELAQLTLDLTELIATLPKPWRMLLELRKAHTMTEAARLMGVPRTTLYYWMRRIRQRFEKAGMKDYL